MVCAALLVGQALAASPVPADERIRRMQQILQPVLVKGEAPKTTPLADRMAELKVPAVSVAVIHEGRIQWARGFGVTRIGGPAVTPDTLFQAASISKPVFALAVMRLVQAGKLNLDANVNDYLKSWKLPDNEFTGEQKVTLRRILSHTAGLTVHGFAGYQAGTEIPTNLQILDGEARRENILAARQKLANRQCAFEAANCAVCRHEVLRCPSPCLSQCLKKHWARVQKGAGR
jgi:CubicO group peptidase (beta-lactamase class C family)